MSGVYTTDNSWMEEVDFSDEEQRCKALDARDAESFNGMLGIRFAEQSPDRTVAELISTPASSNRSGSFMGRTLALVEAAASRAVDMRADYEKERPFGVHIEMRSQEAGQARGVACDRDIRSSGKERADLEYRSARRRRRYRL